MKRFSFIIAVLNLANGFHELSDASEQARRFEQDNFKKKGHQVAFYHHSSR